MVIIKNMSFKYVETPIINNATWQINPKKKIALVGPNGTGKTTLFRLILNELEPDSGSINRQKGIKIGYLPQEGVILKEMLLQHEMLSVMGSVYEDCMKLQSLLSSQQNEMNAISDLQDVLLKNNFYEREQEAKRIIIGLGFTDNDWSRKVSDFSGGWQMRLALAKLLFKDTDLLLLDEPTNHFDEESLAWLEAFLSKYKGTYIIISHDRFFLEKTTLETIELDRGKLTKYSGRYSFYIEQKEKNRQIIEAKAKLQQEEIERLERFIERFKAKNTKSSQANSRMKTLEKIKKIEIEKEAPKIHFEFPRGIRPGYEVVTLNGVSHCYDEKLVLNNFSATIYRGDRIALVGPNGIGKSTLCRILSAEEKPSRGKISWGYHLVKAFFSQINDQMLPQEKTVIEFIRDYQEDYTETFLRTLLGCFLFRGNDVHKKIEMLSGGEKNRLLICRILLLKTNFLILDEPTNHLDLESKDILTDALKEYEGALVVVSHDRYFLKKFANKVWAITSSGLNVFQFGYDDYYEEIHSELWKIDNRKEKDNSSSNSREFRLEQKRKEAELRQKKYHAVKDIKAQVLKLEENICLMEKELKEVEEILAGQYIYNEPERLKNMQIKFAYLKKDLACEMNKWEELNNKIDYIERNYE
ncbi:MAG: ABC-F family ATP-binding cassette domain-containing protein [Candidatus Coatesbacteria bacterium]|nr:ABC-F family ATP-binding cassette domain-containing protein [Candidatus Coatesbacteria bacterium]